jgi:hypothetical protein
MLIVAAEDSGPAPLPVIRGIMVVITKTIGRAARPAVGRSAA